MSVFGTAGPRLFWQILAGSATRQTMGRLLQVLVAAILGVGSTYYAMVMVERQRASEPAPAPAASSVAAVAPATAGEGSTNSDVPREKTMMERALIDIDPHVRTYVIRYSCGHLGFYIPDPAECRDYHDVIRQVEYLRSQPCPDCATQSEVAAK